MAPAVVQHPAVPGVTHEMIPVNVAGTACTVHVARAGIDPSKQLLLFVHGFPECALHHQPVLQSVRGTHTVHTEIMSPPLSERFPSPGFRCAEGARNGTSRSACRFWYSWRGQMTGLQGEYEVAAIDMPGYNASSRPTNRAFYSTGNICAAVAAVLDALGRQRCVLVGHDWGGAVAFDFAALYPSKVDKLAVLAAPAPRLFQRNMDFKQLLKSSYIWMFCCPALPELLLRSGDYAAVARVLRPGSAMGPKRDTALGKEDVAHYKDAIARPGALTAVLNYYRCAACLAHSIAMRWHGNRAALPCTCPGEALWQSVMCAVVIIFMIVNVLPRLSVIVSLPVLAGAPLRANTETLRAERP